MITFFASLLLLLGAGFAVIAALGVVRLPDLYCRMHAATKAGSFGASLALFAAALVYGDVRTAVMAVLTISFFYLTAPIAAHVLARSARRGDVPMAETTATDEWRE